MKVSVGVRKTVFGEIVLDLSELDTEAIINDIINSGISVAKRRIKAKAEQYLEENGTGCVNWYSDSWNDLADVQVENGFVVVEE